MTSPSFSQGEGALDVQSLRREVAEPAPPTPDSGPQVHCASNGFAAAEAAKI